MDVLIALLLTISTAFSLSCKKDTDLLAQVLINDQFVDIENRDSRRIPPDFDWSNIPSNFGNTVWEIKDAFDLRGQTIPLPPNVTLLFKGGILKNGNLIGDDTLITANAPNQVFDAMDLEGTFKNEYVKPYWFGAVMDGVTDDWAAFKETIMESSNISSKVLIEKDMYTDHDVIDATKSLFLEDSTWIEGANDANLIVNNLHSPVFYMVLTRNITIKNLTIVWDNTYDAAWDSDSNINSANVQRLENYLSNTKNIVFDSSNPVWRSSRSLYTIFSIHAAENVLFDNVTFKAKGETPNKFIRWAIKLREEFSKNQTITNNSGITSIPKNISLNNVTMDGVLMGIQGIVDGFKSDGLKSYRYSDMQNADGSNLGGYVNGGYNFPPPHLIYLNQDDSEAHIPQNIEIRNTIDYGVYIGTPATRPTISGYCVSLTLTGTHENVLVDNYKSYRRDGFLGVGDMTNGIFKNIYTEYDSSIFPESITDFKNLRFVGTMNNVTFENVTIKDNAEVAKIYPLDVTDGNHVTLDNVNLYVNELDTKEFGCFGINGSNNTVINSSLTIKKHTSTQKHKGVVVLNDVTMKSQGSDNYYDILVSGWRTINTDPNGRSIRMLFHSASNSNQNYAKVYDVSNNFLIEQINEMKKDTWIRNELVALGQGTSHKLDMVIPSGFTINKISAVTNEGLIKDIKASIGTSTSGVENILLPISNTRGTMSKTINEVNAINSNRPLYVHANGDFQNKGKIEVSLELVRLN